MCLLTSWCTMTRKVPKMCSTCIVFLSTQCTQPMIWIEMVSFSLWELHLLVRNIAFDNFVNITKWTLVSSCDTVLTVGLLFFFNSWRLILAWSAKSTIFVSHCALKQENNQEIVRVNSFGNIHFLCFLSVLLSFVFQSFYWHIYK